MKHVILDPGCFLGLCTAAIEAYNRETNGFVLGANGRRGALRRRRVRVLKTAYPIQTEARRPSFVTHGNVKAFDRARRTVSNLYVGLDLVGGFHSHPGLDGKPRLSRGDVEYIHEELNHLHRLGERPRGWLELVLAIRQREYATPHEIAWTFRRYPKKIGASIAIRPYLGYYVTMAGYWIPAEPNGGGTMVFERPQEARVSIPWARNL